MLSIATLGASDPMLGLHPNLRLGTDYRMTSQGVAIAMTAPILAMFKGIQDATNRAANLFGMPGAITVDGKIGAATGAAVKFTVGKFTDDLRGNLSPGARDGIASAVAMDARNVLGTLLEAIERKSASPVAVTPISPTIRAQPTVLPTVLFTAPPPIPPATVSLRPSPSAALTTFVSTAPAKSGLSTGAWAAVIGAVLVAGIGTAVLVAKRV